MYDAKAFLDDLSRFIAETLEQRTGYADNKNVNVRDVERQIAEEGVQILVRMKNGRAALISIIDDPENYEWPTEGMWRKKPLVVEAKQVSIGNLDAVCRWCGGSVRGTRLPIEQREIEIQTTEGSMRACVGDWVVLGVEGEFYPVKDTVFKKTYEPSERE